MKKETTAERDYKAGQRDAKAGYYDKWYRYNRLDDGKDYDDGYRAMMDSGKAAKHQNIIECMY